MRLDKYLCELNLGTRSQVNKDIKAGLVILALVLVGYIAGRLTVRAAEPVGARLPVDKPLEAALARARSTASPINAARFDIKTPCQADGICHNCNSPESICNHIHFLRNSPRGRHTVVLVGEDLGY